MKGPITTIYLSKDKSCAKCISPILLFVQGDDDIKPYMGLRRVENVPDLQEGEWYEVVDRERFTFQGSFGLAKELKFALYTAAKQGGAILQATFIKEQGVVQYSENFNFDEEKGVVELGGFNDCAPMIDEA